MISFLLTRPLRGATSIMSAARIHSSFLLTRPLRGATRFSPPFADGGISTHTPLAGRDDDGRAKTDDELISTHTPLAGRDAEKRRTDAGTAISTHTPLAGRDVVDVNLVREKSNFYSHAPCGARPAYPVHHYIYAHFYSHAPCGARHIMKRKKTKLENFYSHAPCGARLASFWHASTNSG